MKYYAVKAGINPGIYKSWEECKQNIDGIKGAKYKSFPTLADAESWLEDENYVETELNAELEAGFIAAFCDGSFSADKKRYSYGVLIIGKNIKPVALRGYGDDPECVEARNVAGEVLGALAAMDWAVRHGYKRLVLHHDYEGIAAWAQGRWAVNSPSAKMYKENYNTLFRDVLSVSFKKVKGHSGNKFNDRADLLAKSALDL